eukprot:CAMPEP_0115861542 /NCGR_PEP_ID=MMETSP0287-20121206/17707_1 /TAXON_ID=412157 /ORGANISM="Chrysochromulina rotalis, Strain UIO044" /LENGTH=106 /DNA_ID=CAMNT_0003315921 /DNA_START=147 /DNA_END=471 /DNA_ORIENTATION=-
MESGNQADAEDATAFNVEAILGQVQQQLQAMAARQASSDAALRSEFAAVVESWHASIAREEQGAAATAASPAASIMRRLAASCFSPLSKNALLSTPAAGGAQPHFT